MTGPRDNKARLFLPVVSQIRRADRAVSEGFGAVAAYPHPEAGQYCRGCVSSPNLSHKRNNVARRNLTNADRLRARIPHGRVVTGFVGESAVDLGRLDVGVLLRRWHSGRSYLIIRCESADGAWHVAAFKKTLASVAM